MEFLPSNSVLDLRGATGAKPIKRAGAPAKLFSAALGGLNA